MKVTETIDSEAADAGFPDLVEAAASEGSWEAALTAGRYGFLVEGDTGLRVSHADDQALRGWAAEHGYVVVFEAA